MEVGGGEETLAEVGEEAESMVGSTVEEGAKEVGLVGQPVVKLAMAAAMVVVVLGPEIFRLRRRSTVQQARLLST